MLDLHLLRDLPAGSRVFTNSSHEQVTKDVLVFDSKTDRVLWLSEGGNRTVRQFKCECAPLDAIFCTFPAQNSNQDPAVTVAILLTSTYLRLLQPSGEHFDVRLNTACTGIFATPMGLILQAELRPTSTNVSNEFTSPESPVLLGTPFGGSSSPADFSVMQTSEQARATLFTIAHPTSVTSPVAVRACTPRSNMETSLEGDGAFVLQVSDTMLAEEGEAPGHYIEGMFTSENEEIVAVSGDLLVTLRSEHSRSPPSPSPSPSHRRPADAEHEMGQDRGHRRTLRLWKMTRVSDQEADAALTALRTTGMASLGSGRMSVGSRSSRGSAAAAAANNMFAAGPLAEGHIQPRSSSPSFAHGRASPVTVSAHHTYGWGAEGRESPIAGLENALGLGEGAGLGLGLEREGGGGDSAPIQIPFAGTGTLGDTHSHEGASATQQVRHSISGRPESALLLLDSVALDLPASGAVQNIRFNFSGSRGSGRGEHANRSDALMFNVLDRNSGKFSRYMVVEEESASGSTSSGRLVSLPINNEAGDGLYYAMAHVRIPLLPSSSMNASDVSLSLLLSKRSRGSGGSSSGGGSSASVLIEDCVVGTISLGYLDDLDPSFEAQPVTDIASACGRGGVIVAKTDAGERLLSFPPAVLLGSASCGALELAALSAFRAVPGGRIAANLALAVMILSLRARLQIQPTLLLLRAAFGLPIPISGRSSRNHVDSSLTELYSQLSKICTRIHARAPLFDALHAAWQNLRLQGAQLPLAAIDELGVGLAICCASYGGLTGEAYFTYYLSRIGEPFQHQAKAEPLPDYLERFTAFDRPPCAAHWLGACLTSIGRQYHTEEFLELPSFAIPTQGCQCLDECARFFYRLQRAIVNISSGGASGPPGPRAAQVRLARLWADAYVGENNSDASEMECDRKLQRITLLPPVLRNVIELAIYECREAPNRTWDDEVMHKIGRDDLCKVLPASLGGIELGDAVASGSSIGAGRTLSPSDGLREVEAAAQLRFADDDRVHETCRILRSSESIYLRVEKAPETSDLDHRHRIQLRLLTLCRRSLACCVGRGALTMGSLRPLMAEALPVPRLNLSGRVPPSNGIVHLDTATAPPELTLWPEFHNGVAAGLRIGRAGTDVSAAGRLRFVGGPNEKSHERSAADGGRQVTRNWIIYNRTAANAAAVAASRANVPGAVESAMASHAGVLLALGLQGHLQVLSKNDICDYLSQGNESTTIAMLLGMAASKLGSADTRLSKTLCLYLPTLLPQRHQDIDISPLIQTAALGGLGLLHVGSGHRLMTEFLLAELSRRPTSDRCDSRESAALTAAWALGLVLLGKGGDGSGQGLGGLVDLHIEDRLFQHFSGGKKPPESYLFPTVTAYAGDASGRASRVLEGSEINTDITGPGALVALALIYLRSNNADIAKRMALPETVFALDSIRPDMLLYRALAISLVMWDSVKPTSEWIKSQVPAAVRSALFGDSGPAQDTRGGKENLASTSFFPPASAKLSGLALSPKTALSAYLCIISGYGFGMGLVFAGSGDLAAKGAIHAQLLIVQALRENKTVPGIEAGLVDKSIRPLIDMCVSTLALSLAIVMAGTGDVDCLRTFRELRWRVDDVMYGTHLALGQAIGILFLGGGTCSVRRDPLSVACLLMALCPRYPSRTVDNQYHLQPFRHLYVLAVESRVLRTIDVDSGRPVSVDVKIELTSGNSLHARAPCLLPELETVLAVHVNSMHDDVDCAADITLNTSGTSLGSANSADSCHSASSSSPIRTKRSLFHRSHAGGSGRATQRANDLYPTGLPIMAENVRSGTPSALRRLEVPALCVKRRVQRPSSSLSDPIENQSSSRIISAVEALLFPFSSEAGGLPGTSEPVSLQPSQGNELTLELVMNMLARENSEVDELLCAGISSCSPLNGLLNGELSIGL